MDELLLKKEITNVKGKIGFIKWGPKMRNKRNQACIP